MKPECPNLEDLFYGSATLGERGQIVIPAEARKALDMHPGDKLLVFRHPMHPHLLNLAKISDMQEIMQQVTRTLAEAGQKIDELSKDESEEE